MHNNLLRSTSVLSLLMMSFAPAAWAADWAWSTSPASALFSGVNWTSGTTPGAAAGTPSSGDNLFFGTSSQLSPNNNFSGYTFGGLTFNTGASAFTISGNAFTLGSAKSIVNSSSSAQIINNDITLSGAGTISASAGNLTLGGAISDGSQGYNLTLTGGKSITLSSANNFGGTLAINNGTTVSIGSAGSLGNGTAISFGGSSVSVVSASAGLTIPSTYTITVTSGSNAKFTSPTLGNTFQIAAKVTGAGGCQQGSGSGTVRFSADTSDYAGNFSVGYGTIEYTSVANGGTASSLGAGSTAYTIGNSSSAGTFRYVGSGNSTTSRAINWSATTGGLTLDNTGSGSVQFLATGNLRSASGNATLTLNGSNTGANTLAQAINDGAASGVTTVNKAGAGTWNLTGINTHSGGTTLSSGGGLLNLGNASALGTGPFTISGNSSFDNTTGGEITVNNAFTLSGGSPTYVGSANMTINGPVTLSGANRTITVTGNTLTLGGAIGQDVSGRSLTKAGAGTLVVASSTASTYSGGTVINAGTLSISAANQLGTGTAITFSGSATLQATAAVTLPGATTISLNSGTATFDNTASAANTFEIAAKLTGTAACKRASQSSSGKGPIRFSNNANDYTGAFSQGYGLTEFTSVANGGSPSALGAGSTAYGMNNGNSAANFRYVGSTDTSTTRAISWATTGDAGALTLDNTGSGAVQYLATGTLRSGTGSTTLTLHGSNTGNNTLAQVINDPSGTTAVTKAGDGKWLLTAANTYTGGTAVNAGTLEIGGTGSIKGNVTVNGGLLKLDNASALQSTGNLTLPASPSADVGLSFVGTQSVNALYFGAAQQDQGTWGAVGSEAEHEHAAFIGTGILQVNTGNHTPVAKSFSLGAAGGRSVLTQIIGGKPAMAPTDGDSDPMTVNSVGTAAHGTVTTDGAAITYTPANDYSGGDSFTYTVSDGHSTSAPATVTVTVAAGGGVSPNVVSGPAYANGKFTVTFAGIPGLTYTVEYAEGSAAPPWGKLKNLNADTSGMIVVEDAVSQTPSRYYRIVYPSY